MIETIEKNSVNNTIESNNNYQTITLKSWEVKLIKHFISNDKLKYALEYVLFDNGKIIALNGRAMIVYDTKQSMESLNNKIFKLPETGNNKIIISMEENNIFCNIIEKEYIKKVQLKLSDNFPNYKIYIPKNFIKLENIRIDFNLFPKNISGMLNFSGEKSPILINNLFYYKNKKESINLINSLLIIMPLNK